MLIDAEGGLILFAALSTMVLDLDGGVVGINANHLQHEFSAPFRNIFKHLWRGMA